LTPITEPVDNPEEVARELLMFLTMALVDASLLQFSVYRDALQRAFERGLGHKLIFGRPYDEVRMIFEDADLRQAIPTECRRPEPQGPWEPVQSDELYWRGGPGPGYSNQAAVDNARARYTKIGARLPRQLEMLRSEDDFSQVVSELRGRGWREHHILASVYNVALNLRARATGIDLRDVEAARTLRDRPETENSPLVPTNEFTVEAMEHARRRALPAVLMTWGLTLHSPTPDLDAVEKVLAERYAYWTADASYDGDLLPH
jgi:hypothetical protein